MAKQKIPRERSLAKRWKSFHKEAARRKLVAKRASEAIGRKLAKKMFT